MTANANKMDSSEVYGMFETLVKLVKKQAEKQTEKQVEPAEPVKVDIDISAIDAATERFLKAAEEAKKPVTIEHRHRHTIDIGSSKVFLSLVIMTLTILGLCYVVGEQRKSISQFKENDLKYRYIKMQGQTNEENLYRLERQFQYNDSIKIIRKQVEKYEELVREQAERVERARQKEQEAKRLREEAENLKNNK
jgi:hypothetical protein